MGKWLWRQIVWPQVIRPWLQKRALVIGQRDRVALAAAIEAARVGGPVTEVTIATVNGAVNDAICAALETARL